MFGFEFSDKKTKTAFPKYDPTIAISPKKIKRVVPLVWQEHCVECGMPECYKTCSRYQRRSDGRCKLFKNGIEHTKNPDAIFNQNAKIEMRDWAKLQTFFFWSAYSYKTAKKINGFYVTLAKIAQLAKIGAIRRVCYYIKEFCSRKIGYKKNKDNLPEFLVFELFNDQAAYALSLENHSSNTVLYRNMLQVNPGYNRFVIPTKNLNFTPHESCSLCIYSCEGKEVTLNIISLEMVDFIDDYRKEFVSKNEKKVKMVVWDLDNTVWDGILSEDGVEGISLKQEIVSVIKELDEKGIVNSIASKNDYDKIIPVLKQLGIDEYFVSPMINWNPKSENIKELSKNINLNMDTFVFVDDTPNELQEVLANCDGIRVCDVDKITEYVKESVFDVPVTEESRNRRKMYQQADRRNQTEQQYKNNVDEFLKDCKMFMHIKRPAESEIERCFELIQRTNQLNISAQRLSRSELEELLSSDKYDCYRIKVDDKYGDYGLVGFAVFEKRDEENIVLNHFVFSCRAARKKLEQSFFETIIDIYKEKGYKTLSLVCKKTDRNALMQSVLIESGLFKKENDNSNSFVLTTSLETNHLATNIATICMD